MNDVADTVHHQNISALLKLQALFIVTTFLLAIFHLSVSQTSVQEKVFYGRYWSSGIGHLQIGRYIPAFWRR